jgi:dihydropteroate synthase
MRQLFRLDLPGGRSLTLGERTVVVGVLNVTPDSFSDGGKHFLADAAIGRALQMESEGADVIEVGGESTRPGAHPLTADEELSRVVPVLKAIAPCVSAPISIDTYKSEVAKAALALGASIVNDVSALRFDVRLGSVVSDWGAALVLMHMRGEPASMQKLEPSADIFAEIERDLNAAVDEALRRGVRRERVVIDPGIGFGKTLEQNLAIINHLDRFAALGLPLMIGTSRKSFIGRLTGQPVSDRVFGTAASVAIAISRGAHFVRVHDVKEMAEVVRVADAISASDLGSISSNHSLRIS